MESFRTYGHAPFQVAVVHGGPGAPGSMAPVARRLSGRMGVMEPFQTAMTLKGQMAELAQQLSDHLAGPAILVGHSWGAMLSYLVSARYPRLVKKLIMISSGMMDEASADQLLSTRLSRLAQADRNAFLDLVEQLHRPTGTVKDHLMGQLGALCVKADSLAPLSLDTGGLKCDYEQFSRVWPEMEKIRHSGELLSIGSHIQCPVVALHGDYDPHPAQKVKEPLGSVIRDFEFILLSQCGHWPWLEKEAQEGFFKHLEMALKT